ncbi:MAG: alpha/beta hydrolase, partial [Anaerolineales bacterium]|nr:alpha/beta hydrolase [Anaerolineales bacterium]
MERGLRVTLAVVGLLLAAVIILPLVIPIPSEGEALLPQELADEDSRFIEVKGLDVHYKQAGQGGTPLLLLHGFGSHTFTWRNVLGPLGDGRQVFAFDRPGFGLTERPMPPFNGPNPYSQSAQAQLTVDLIDEMGFEEVVLVGNSAGGTIALLTSLNYPGRVSALVLVDPAVYMGSGSPSWARPLMALPQVRRLGPLLARNIRDWGVDMIGFAWHDPSRITPDVVPGYKLPLRIKDWDRALYEFTLASETLDLPSRLAELEMPVLVITGDDDRIVP